MHMPLGGKPRDRWKQAVRQWTLKIFRPESQLDARRGIYSANMLFGLFNVPFFFLTSSVQHIKLYQFRDFTFIKKNSQLLFKKINKQTGNRGHIPTELWASRLPFKWSMFSAVLPVPAFLFSPTVLVPARAGSQVKHHSLKVKHAEGCTAFLLWWWKVSEDYNIGKWVGE